VRAGCGITVFMSIFLTNMTEIANGSDKEPIRRLRHGARAGCNAVVAASGPTGTWWIKSDGWYRRDRSVRGREHW
jgi:hypothetical protein